jgi:hypothetical protein
MTQYKYPTDPTKMIEAELGVVAGQLVTKDGSGNTVVVGNPANSTAVSDLTPNYAEDAMDISSVRTLGSGFIFLNGTSFDAMGVGNYEFEEANGAVYGLYGRTDGISQQVYFSGAASNQEPLQYTTVPYVPPFLSGSAWQAAAVSGSDLQGFTLVLRDTTPGNTSALRYIYVRHNGSLINTAGHTYVEITPVVNSYLSVTTVPGLLAKVVRVGAFFFISLASWQDGAVWFAGWNAQDSSFPFISTALPASPITYNPLKFTVSTNGWPTSDVTAQTFPNLMGSQAPGTVNNFRIYNTSNGAVTTPAVMNAPLPLPSGWAVNSCARMEGEDNGSGTPLMALGCQLSVQDVAGLGASAEIVYTFLVSFDAGGLGAYTNAVLNFIGPTFLGADSLHCQPAPFILSSTAMAPNEGVASSPATPSTCVNKLPVASYYNGFQQYGVRSPFTHWYYSGHMSSGAVGIGAIFRGLAKAGSQLGSLAAAQANKRSMIYPMWNVSPRADFNQSTGATMARSFVQPSGAIASTYYGHMVAQDTLLTVSLSAQFATQWTVSKFPANSQITDTSYNRFGTSIPGFRGRVAEYLTNLPNPNLTLSTWGCVWPTGIANLNAPVNFNFPVMSTNGTFSANGAACRVGSWTLSGSTYQAPPVLWNYAANMDTQLAALRTSVIAAAQAAFPNTGVSGTIYAIDVVPVMNSAGTGIAFAYGLLHSSHNNGSGFDLQTTFFTTPCAVSGSTINLTNTGSVTILHQEVVGTSGVIGGYPGSDVLCGRLFVVYGAGAGNDWYLAWSNPNAITVIGDNISTPSFARFNASNALVSIGAVNRSQSRSPLSCSAQHHGLGIMPYRDSVTIPEPDMPISRYATTAIATQGDFATSFAAAIANPSNLVNGAAPFASNNLAEVLSLQAISNTFLLQIGAINGRINKKAYDLPSTYIDMTGFAVGTYYLYLTDTGSGGIQVQVDAAQRAESATNTYFGKFDRTSSGFANESSISEMIRFGNARLVSGSNGSAVQGSSIRVGPYVG